MSWIAVHEDVLGSKLRGFRKTLCCSEAEALGILTFIWLWARKNAKPDGLLENTDIDDISAVIAPILNSSLYAPDVIDALISNGWIDKVDDSLFIHDWYEWQQYWYNYLDKKEKDKLRKRAERERSRENKAREESKTKKDEKEDASDDRAKSEKPKKPPKTKYAEDVSMYESEYAKLVEKYGEEFAKKLVEELNNYKLANGKKYKDDYRAILNWVVDKCKTKYPGLIKPQSNSSSDNPFAEYM